MHESSMTGHVISITESRQETTSYAHSSCAFIVSVYMPVFGVFTSFFMDIFEINDKVVNSHGHFSCCDFILLASFIHLHQQVWFECNGFKAKSTFSDWAQIYPRWISFTFFYVSAVFQVEDSICKKKTTNIPSMHFSPSTTTTSVFRLVWQRWPHAYITTDNVRKLLITIFLEGEIDVLEDPAKCRSITRIKKKITEHARVSERILKPVSFSMTV